MQGRVLETELGCLLAQGECMSTNKEELPPLGTTVFWGRRECEKERGHPPMNPLGAIQL